VVEDAVLESGKRLSVLCSLGRGIFNLRSGRGKRGELRKGVGYWNEGWPERK